MGVSRYLGTTTDPSCFQCDRLENELIHEQDQFKSITEELEATFVEMSGF